MRSSCESRVIQKSLILPVNSECGDMQSRNCPKRSESEFIEVLIRLVRSAEDRQAGRRQERTCLLRRGGNELSN